MAKVRLRVRDEDGKILTVRTFDTPGPGETIGILSLAAISLWLLYHLFEKLYRLLESIAMF